MMSDDADGNVQDDDDDADGNVQDDDDDDNDDDEIGRAHV